MAQGIVQPKVLMERVLAQFDSMLPADRAQSPFLAGVRAFPEGVSAEDQARLRTAYENMVAHLDTMKGLPDDADREWTDA